MSVTTRPAALRSNALPVVATLAGGGLLLALLFLPECRAALGVWLSSTAYGHCFLVLPMAVYLAWDRRNSLRGLQPRPTLTFVWLTVPVMLAWFAAERLGIMEGRQLAALAALEVMFLSVLGQPLFRALSGPLLYLVFLVPFGAFITPALQSFTAGFIGLGLSVLGIPAYITDFTIEISAGSFYVAEACAGLRFLIAAVAFGVFYALLNYRSPGRRAAFIAASVAVPIVANGFRALGIVVLGNVLGSAEAAAADHVIYGWGFFSVVMLILVAAGMPWREAPLPAPSRRPTSQAGTGLVWPALVVAGLCATGPAAAALLNRRADAAGVPVALALAPPPGCVADAPATSAGGETRIAFRCEDGEALTVTTIALPAHAQPDQLQRERLRLSVPLGAEDTSVSAVHNAPADAGRWSLYDSREPDLMAAAASWVDGVPAEGGLAGRLRLAWDSLHGPSHVPLVMVVVPHLSGRPTSADRSRARELVQQFIGVQRGLTPAVAAATQVGRV